MENTKNYISPYDFEESLFDTYRAEPEWICYDKEEIEDMSFIELVDALIEKVEDLNRQIYGGNYGK